MTRYQKIVILCGTYHNVEQFDLSTKVINIDDLRVWIFRGELLKHLFRYKDGQCLVNRLETMPKPFLTGLVLRLLCRKRCCFEDDYGKRQPITLSVLRSLFLELIRDLRARAVLLHRIHNEVTNLLGKCGREHLVKKLDLAASPVYLRTDLSFGVRAGGSVGHIAGVLNNLSRFFGTVIFLTADRVPTVSSDSTTHVILPAKKYWDFVEVPSLFYNETFERKAREIIDGTRVSFIYQRYGLNNYSGVRLSKELNTPFVLEYNGSEVWINRYWRNRLKYEPLSERIELLNLNTADVVVVVSQPIKDELVARGIEADKILVNPNGVDPERCSPEVDGSGVRHDFDLQGKIVLGFIATFDPWHGAEILTEAFGRLIQQFPRYRDLVRLMMIGDGLTMPKVKERRAKFNLMDACILTGLIPQDKGPTYLAACDILVSPHVPNPDGSPFFGSPTKLFEYMAMGKGIVASDLAQIGEVLTHGETAWLVKPGDVDSLMLGLKMLIDDGQRRSRLGRAARREVVAKHTWLEHTRRIIEKLEERCG